MKKLLLIIPLVALFIIAQAQVETPAPSPMGKIEQKVGLTDVKVTYSRPGIKNRKIFGELVAYDAMWRTGANAATVVSFSNDVKIGGQALPKGEYALYSIPGFETWDIIFYKDTDNWGLPKKYDLKKEGLKITVESDEMLHTIENFTINIDNLRDASASLDLYWENTLVRIPFTVDTDKAVMANIDKVLSGPERGDYYSAARYFYANDKDMDQALAWVKKANSIDEKFWQLRLESLILAKLDKKDDAIVAATKSMAMAQEAGNQNYVDMNKKSLMEWMESEIEELKE